MLKRTILILIIFVTAYTVEAQRRGFYYWDEFGQFFCPCDSFNLYDSLNNEITLAYYKSRRHLDDSLTLEGLYRFKKLGDGFYRVYSNWHRRHFRRPEYFKFDNCSVWDSDKDGNLDVYYTSYKDPWKQTRRQGEHQEGIDSVVYLSTFFVSKTDTFLRTNYKEFYLAGKVKERWTKEEYNGGGDFNTGNYRILKFMQDSLGRNCQENFNVDSNLKRSFSYRSCPETVKDSDGRIIESRSIWYHEERELPWAYLTKYYYRGDILIRVEYISNGVIEELLIFEPYDKKTHGRRRRP